MGEVGGDIERGEGIGVMALEHYKDVPLGIPWAEAQGIYPLVKEYTEGKLGLDIGCGAWKIPGSIGIDIRPGVADVVGDIQEGLAALLTGHVDMGYLDSPKNRLDYIFSSHLIEDFTEVEQRKLLEDWLQFLRAGGYLILYVPEKDRYPSGNPIHKREFARGELAELLASVGLNIVAIRYDSDYHQRGYGILGIGQKK